MIPNPIRRVLTSIQTHRVRALLMGGQACVLYGAAEFSRDTDFAVLASPANLAAALAAEEQAERSADAAYWRPLKAELEKLRHEPRRLQH